MLGTKTAQFNLGVPEKYDTLNFLDYTKYKEQGYIQQNVIKMDHSLTLTPNIIDIIPNNVLS